MSNYTLNPEKVISPLTLIFKLEIEKKEAIHCYNQKRTETLTQAIEYISNSLDTITLKNGQTL